MAELTISSVKNPRVQAAARLRERRHRDRQGQILIDGARELARAMDAGVELVDVFINQQQASDAVRSLQARLQGLGTAVFSVTPHVFEKLAYGDRAEGIVAVARPPRSTLADLQLPGCPLVAVLERCEKPGNLGAVLRSADAAGVSAVIVADPATDLFNPNAIRASMGTIFSLPVAQGNTAETLAFLIDRRLAIVAARVDATRDYTEIDFRRPTALVLGSEANGLSAAWRRDDVTAIKLPMCGVADSLNVSATAAVLFYEALRQRR